MSEINLGVLGREVVKKAVLVGNGAVVYVPKKWAGKPIHCILDEEASPCWICESYCKEELVADPDKPGEKTYMWSHIDATKGTHPPYPKLEWSQKDAAVDYEKWRVEFCSGAPKRKEKKE